MSEEGEGGQVGDRDEPGGVPAIRRAVVLGAGVMGSQIAALLANAGIEVELLDVAGEEDAAAPAREGLERALKSRPPAFFVREMGDRVTPGCLVDLTCIGRADWVIEAVVEDMDVKRDLLDQVEAAAGPGLVISTNTSGLSIRDLAQGRDPAFARRLLGIHFFNPPRYMKLVELIPGPDTDPDLVAGMRGFVEEELGKGVVMARDTPNFIANRLGVFALMEALHRMEREGLSAEVLDGLTGPLLGRPRSATLRLCDLIGLDTLVHVAGTAHDGLPDDRQRQVFSPPERVQQMLEQGLLGAKSGGGFYRKTEAVIQALEPETMEYRDLRRPDLGDLGPAAGDFRLQARLQAVWDDDGLPTAWQHLRQVLLYAADNAAEMAADLAQVDRAMKWGFNWEAGPFELWDQLGVPEVADRCEREGEPVPALVRDLLATGETRFYAERDGAPTVFAAEHARPVALPLSPDEELARRLGPDRALLQNESAYLVEADDGIGVLVLRGKMNVLGAPSLELVQQVVAEAPFAAVVLWGAGSMFSAGADLRQLVALAEAGDWDGVDAFVRAFQQAIIALRQASFPVVAAPRGLALAGGCEFCMGVDARVVAAELQMGLVETGVGLIPGGGGCTEMARRCGEEIEPAFRTLFAGTMSDNAHQARQWRLLTAEDQIVMNDDRLLRRAIECARALGGAGYRAPAEAGLWVAGDPGRQRLDEWLDAQHREGAISAHDRTVGRALARALCGGPGPAREVSAQEVLDLERETFVHLCGLAPTQERMRHMLKTGKPLRN